MGLNSPRLFQLSFGPCGMQSVGLNVILAKRVAILNSSYAFCSYAI